MTNDERRIETYKILNPETKDDQFICRPSGVIEWVCKHGVGHPIDANIHNGIHGCDGCCVHNRMVASA